MIWPTDRSIALQRSLTTAEERLAVLRVSLILVLQAAGVTVANNATDDQLHEAAGQAMSWLRKEHEFTPVYPEAHPC